MQVNFVIYGHKCVENFKQHDFFIYYMLNKITPLLCFHSNFHIALNNGYLFMDLQLTNERQDILLSI